MPLDGTKVTAPPMVYIAGEEMTHYACELVLEQWFAPYFTMDQWRYFDLSCKNRDATNDQVLHDAVKAGAEIGAIFKEPTITPSAVQVKEFGLSKALGSPNGAMRRGWNGITISRDTIHIEGIDLGYKNQVFFERHAVGGEYSAGWDQAGEGTLLTTYLPKDGSPPFVVDKRDLTDKNNVVVVYHNPYDNVGELAHIFFQRCLDAGITPYVVTKKTVFKWQEGFWATMKKIFDQDYKEKFAAKGLLDKCGGELQHLISDAATMQLIRWTDGGFGMAAHNYDGDMRKSPSVRQVNLMDYWNYLLIRQVKERITLLLGACCSRHSFIIASFSSLKLTRRICNNNNNSDGSDCPSPPLARFHHQQLGRKERRRTLDQGI